MRLYNEECDVRLRSDEINRKQFLRHKTRISRQNGLHPKNSGYNQEKTKGGLKQANPVVTERFYEHLRHFITERKQNHEKVCC